MVGGTSCGTAGTPEFASFSDIDWDLDPDGRIVLPVLGSDDDVAGLAVDRDVPRLGDLAFPIAPGTDADAGAQVHDRQHYRLVGWRNGRAAIAGSSRSPRWPDCVRRIPAVFERTRRRVARFGSPRDAGRRCASTIRTASPTRRATCRCCADKAGS